MMTPSNEYGVSAFLNSLPGYNSSSGVDEMLELMRTIQESEGYYWQGVTFPFGSDITILAQTTRNGSIQLPPGTIITSINYYVDTEGAQRNGNTQGFKFKLYDKGSLASIFYGDYALDRTVVSNMELQYGVGASNIPSDPGMNLDNPFGPAYLISPFIVTPPGLLEWEIVNLGTVDTIVQFLLSCAIPILDGTVNQVIVNRS